ncbi:uncharacterized protein B0H18DRAFT_1114878 [Fomitopsis serialis]|uniref:uncharacterized protein n=1 Tax=Fomitopsis serialis TaxID=139415 RepID=UPI002008C116|nr:uncharacterized protein B0H18DRAFT_1114878 [Neoantrodia serialis]KAH9934132.1 hypothetical protein B0H18DRAFT_1114878 [Neoantrodia serialis]
MFQSVFNRRKVQRTINQITGVRRPQSPPSPASFVSEDVVDIHEKLHPRFLPPPPDGSRGRPHEVRDSTPRVHLELDAHRQSSYSDWFPRDMLRNEVRTPPPRDASLSNNNAAGSSTTVNELSHDHSWEHDRSFGASSASLGASTDGVILIEPVRADGRNKALPLPVRGDSDSDYQIPLEPDNDAIPIIRRPTPTPIRIPDNPASSKIAIERSAGPSAGGHAHLPVPSAHSNGPTRPSSPGSVGTEDLSSSVSGTTLARALVNSFIVTNESRGSRYRNVLTRQDSATLPRGEHPFHGRYGRSNSVDSPDSEIIPPVPPLPSSAELSARGLDSGKSSRRNSTGAALENRISSAELPYASDGGAGGARRNSLIHNKGDQPPTVFSPISPITEQPSPAPSAPNTPTFNALVNGSNGNISSGSLSQASSMRRSTNLSEAYTTTSSQSSLTGDHRRQSTDLERSRATSEVSLQSESDRPQRPAGARAMSFSTSLDSGVSMSVYSPSTEGTPLESSSAGASSMRNHRAMSTGSPVAAFGNTYVARSRSDSSVHRTGGSARPTLLPIGERPHSVLVPRSPEPRTSAESDTRPYIPRSHFGPLPSGVVPVTARLPVTGRVHSLSMSARSREGPARSNRSGTQPAPLALAILDRHAGLPTPTLTSAVESGGPTLPPFPETPYAFSPLLSAGMASPYPPMPPRGPNGSRSALPHTLGPARTSDMKMRWQQQKTILQRSATTVGRSNGGLPTPPNSMEGSFEGGSLSVNGHQRSESEVVPGAMAARPLPSIQEARSPSMSPSPPGSRRDSQAIPAQMPAYLPPVEEVAPRPSMDSEVPNIPDMGQTIDVMSSPPRSLRGRSTLPPPLTPLPPVPDDNAESPKESPPPAYTQAESSSIDAYVGEVTSVVGVEAAPFYDCQLVAVSAFATCVRGTPSSLSSAPSPMPSINEHPIEHPPPPPYEAQRAPRAAPLPAPPPSPLRAAASSSSARSATPELSQPKRPRARPAIPLGPRKPSVQGRSRTGSVSSVISNQLHGGPSAMRKPSMATLASASSPKFQTTPVKFRGLTKEAAEWTLSSQQLQQIVSTAIRQTADIARLELRCADLKTSYKLNVRRRRMLLGTLSSMADGSEPADPASATRISDELSEVTDALDFITEELYDVNTQVGQLNHLRDVHSSSALIMALHKLNRSLKKHLTEGQKLREQLETLEAERDEAWRQAQEVAQDFDDLAERALDQPVANGKEITPSRRSSRVVLARKNSSRRAQNGLRSGPGHRRSQRSSVSSAQPGSGVSLSPAPWSTGAKDIPPVPPVPPRSTLGIVTDLPSGRTAMSSSGTPSSEFKAMTEAQKELCDMLGISLDDLKSSSRPSRRQSMSDAPGSSSFLSPSRGRRNSESRIASPRPSPGLQSPSFA